MYLRKRIETQSDEGQTSVGENIDKLKKNSLLFLRHSFMQSKALWTSYVQS